MWIMSIEGVVMISTDELRYDYQMVYASLTSGLNTSQIILLNSLLDMARELEVREECDD